MMELDDVWWALLLTGSGVGYYLIEHAQKSFNNWLISRNIQKSGWPPKHLNADGTNKEEASLSEYPEYGDWTDVDDELPHDLQTCIVSFLLPDGNRGIGFTTFEPSVGWKMTITLMTGELPRAIMVAHRITHWMPQPDISTLDTPAFNDPFKATA